MAQTGKSEIAMLELVVLPKIEEVRELLKKEKLEEATRIVNHDILEPLRHLRNSERGTFANVPENLKSAPNSVRMMENAKICEEVIQNLCDEGAGKTYDAAQWDLDFVESKVREIVQNQRG